MKKLNRLIPIVMLWCAMLSIDLREPRQALAGAIKIDNIAPSSVQSEGELTITLNGTIKSSLVQSVKIGDREATLIFPQETDSKVIKVKLDKDTPLGLQPVFVQVGDQKIFGRSVLVLPLVRGVKVQETLNLSAEVATRDNVTIQLSDAFTEGLVPVVRIGNQNALVKKLENKQLVIMVPDQLSRGDHKVRVSVQGTELLAQPTLSVFPPPNATVTDISPKVVQVGTRVKISGTGFFAPPEQIILLVDGVAAETTRVAPDGTWFAAVIQNEGNGKSLGPGQKSIEVTILGVPTGIPDQLQVMVQRRTGWILTAGIVGVALLPLLLVGSIIYWLYQAARKQHPWLEALVLEPENKTYSLSRAQFYWWLSIIAYAYFFLFIARGFIEDTWSLPALSGFAYTFLISLGTVVLAQATSAVKGAKGAGSVKPSRADLITNGGVIAPERVQQVVWSVLAGLGFLWITIRTYTTATALPTIPDELLILMGISSAGYLGGKLGRRPGPIIKQILVEKGSIRLKIHGEHLSKDAYVWVDGVQQPKDVIKTLKEANPDRPNDFAKALLVQLPDISMEAWYGREHTITIINADGQRGEWKATFPKITAVTLTPSSDPDDKERVILRIEGSGILPEANLVVGDAPADIKITQDQDDPNHWDILIRKARLKQEVKLEITNPEGQKYAYLWKVQQP
jgi:hypothetical protein